jgi:hypothetical protein
MPTTAWKASTKGRSRTHRPLAKTATLTKPITFAIVCMAKILNLPKQGRFERIDGGEHLIDAAKFCFGAGRNNNPGGATRYDQRP